MKNLKIISLLILVAFTGCNDEDLELIGSGNVINYKLEVDPFNKVALWGPVNLRITQDHVQSLSVDAEPEIFSKLSYEVNHGTLEIGFRENISRFVSDHGVWINVTLPNITRIEQSGDSQIISDGEIILDQLELIVSGKAEIALSGQVENHSIICSGLITSSNFDLMSRSTKIDVSGSAILELFATDRLEINVDGSATLYYKGNPEISQTSSGSIQLINVN
jgi:hypothetical protein